MFQSVLDPGDTIVKKDTALVLTELFSLDTDSINQINHTSKCVL